MDNRDKRRHFRKSLQTEASIGDQLGNSWQPVSILDISSGGLAFLTKEELSAGSSRLLRFHLPNHSEYLVVIVKIVHSTSHLFLQGNRIGAEFARISPEHLSLVEEYLEIKDDEV